MCVVVPTIISKGEVVSRAEQQSTLRVGSVLHHVVLSWRWDYVLSFVCNTVAFQDVFPAAKTGVSEKVQLVLFSSLSLYDRSAGAWCSRVRIGIEERPGAWSPGRALGVCRQRAFKTIVSRFHFWSVRERWFSQSVALAARPSARCTCITIWNPRVPLSTGT